MNTYLIGFLVASVFVSFYIIWKLILHHQRASRERLLIAITACSVLEQNIAYIIEITSSTVGEVLTAIKFEYLGSTTFVLFYMHLVYQYCHKRVPKVVTGISVALFCQLTILRLR